MHQGLPLDSYVDQECVSRYIPYLPILHLVMLSTPSIYTLLSSRWQQMPPLKSLASPSVTHTLAHNHTVVRGLLRNLSPGRMASLAVKH